MEELNSINELAYAIVSYYTIFTEVLQEENGVHFKYENREYKLWVFNDRYMRPTITIIGDPKLYPHYLTYERVYQGVKYHIICLFDDTEYVNAIIDPKEKISDVVNRFVTLVSLSHAEIEAEYQKEFLLYWHRATTQTGVKNELYLDGDMDYYWLKKFEMSKTVHRFSKNNDVFNDNPAHIYTEKEPVFYVKVVNTQGILPPFPDKPWNANVINEILKGSQIQHITCDAYKELTRTTYSHRRFTVVFCMSNVYFACEIEFKNSGSEKLIRKIECGIVSVKLINISRCDFAYLSEQIGNDDLLLNKTIAIIGCGSLGSYVAEEVVRSGCKSVILVDDDTYEYSNVLRHKIPFFFNSCYKVSALEYHLKGIHPEVKVLSFRKRLDASSWDEIISLNPDILISTIGGSDSQLVFNQFFHDRKTHIPVIYSWLEGDGATSHALCATYDEGGCYECLFTDENGNLKNNKVNIAGAEDFRYIRNGCGGTRVAYGNSTLISGSFITLFALKKVISDPEFKPCLYSFINNSIQQNKGFASERCRCCGKH